MVPISKPTPLVFAASFWLANNIVLQHHPRLMLRQTLQHQGITSGSSLTCTYVPMSIHDAWCFLQGHLVSSEEFALEGMKQLKGVRCLEEIRYLPKSLETLVFQDEFNETLKGIHFPSGLQSLTFGYDFDQSLQGIDLPESLQSLRLGKSFDQTLTDVKLPNLQSLAFGGSFSQSLEGFEAITSYVLFFLGFVTSHPTSLKRKTLNLGLHKVFGLLWEKDGCSPPV